MSTATTTITPTIITTICIEKKNTKKKETNYLCMRTSVYETCTHKVAAETCI